MYQRPPESVIEEAKRLRAETNMTWEKIGRRLGYNDSTLRKRCVGRHPDGRIAGMLKDSLTDEGAERIARKIEAYWRKQGKSITVWIDTIKMSRDTLHGVRSDMKNGVPQ